MNITIKELNLLRNNINVTIHDVGGNRWFIANNGKRIDIKYGNNKTLKSGLIKYVGIEQLLSDPETMSILLERCKSNTLKNFMEGC